MGQEIKSDQKKTVKETVIREAPSARIGTNNINRLDLAQQAKSASADASLVKDAGKGRLHAACNGPLAPLNHVNDINKKFRVDGKTSVDVLSPQQTRAVTLALFNAMGFKGDITA